jgi:hypothetical protein
MQLSDEPAIDRPYSRIATSGKISIGARLVAALPVARAPARAGLAASVRLSLISIAGRAVGPVTRQPVRLPLSSPRSRGGCDALDAK